MPAEVKKEIELEIAHVLFLDIVGYSKLSVNEQHGRVDELNGIVRLSEQYQKAEAANRILKIPTGDGMALVFYRSPEEPAQCAFEISRALKDNQRLQVRMGIHSGPISGVVDVNERTNVAGAGINLAQRVMDCGDAGHILVSRHVAEDLAEYERWRPFLHDIGTFEVKHGVRVSVTNLYLDEVGNPRLPSKLQAVRKRRAHLRWAEIGAALLVLGAIIAGVFFVARNLREIAQQLGVANVVEGSVQRSGNRVRVNAQLIDARNDAHLWAQTYDRDLDDVFAIQSEIAKAIADQLQAKLSPAEKNAIEERPTSDLIAFDQYSRAKTLILTTSLNPSDKNLLQAIELLNGAVARDPSFHAAFCQLVFAHDQLYSFSGDHTPARLAAAEAALQRAIELRPNAAETHLARGAHLSQAFRDYKGALSELEAARAGLANDPRILQFTGSILLHQGRPEEGLRALEQAVALDPRNPYMLSRLAISYECLRRYPEEKATLQRILEITPDDIAVASSIAFVDLDW